MKLSPKKTFAEQVSSGALLRPARESLMSKFSMFNFPGWSQRNRKWYFTMSFILGEDLLKKISVQMGIDRIPISPWMIYPHHLHHLGRPSPRRQYPLHSPPHHSHAVGVVGTEDKLGWCMGELILPNQATTLRQKWRSWFMIILWFIV